MDPRLIVEVRWGPMNGRKVTIAPGKTLRVGRTDMADFEVPHDDHLSRVHFSINWDGKRCLVRDHGSQEGTLVDGEPMEEGEIGHGGWIRAGETDFSVYIEDKVPPPDDDDSSGDENSSEDERWLKAEERAEKERRRDAARSALARLREEAAKELLFGILDAARDDRILELLRQSVEPHQSLYEGIQGEPLATVAPYLVGPFRKDSVLLDRLVMEGWGKRWGIYVRSRESFKEVRRHFRRFLIVEIEETGEPLYFRFYDPWVMKTFWSSSLSRQAVDLLGPNGAVLAEGESHRLLTLHVGERRDGGTLSL